MTDRTILYKQFVERFHEGKKVRPALEEQFAAAEAALGIACPESWKQFSLSYGAVYTPSILTRLVQSKANVSDVQQFLTPKQAVTETKRWKLEPNGGCIAFASDCSGNFFAFRELSAAEPRPADAAVWLFDHEEANVTQQAASFDEWLLKFLDL
jgi:hypothetical protein